MSYRQVYAPTGEVEKETIEAFYKKLTEVVNKFPKKKNTIIIGDFNAKRYICKEK